MLPSSADLFYYHHVATDLHISHAAKNLNVSQPSLSIAIKRLESLLDTSLFIRHKQGVSLTRAGHELYRDVKIIFAQWQQSVAKIKATSDTMHGVVRIGCHSTLTPFMRGMVSQLYDQYPHLEIHFQHELTVNILDNIINGRCDIGLVTDPYPHPDMILQQIGTTEFGFWVSKTHEAKCNLLSHDTIFICNPVLPQTQYLIEKLLKITGHAQLKQNTMNQLEAIASMTIEGYGIGILPSNYTKKFFGDKLTLLSDAPQYNQPLCLAYRPENRNVKSVQVVVAAIKNLAKNEAEHQLLG